VKRSHLFVSCCAAVTLAAGIWGARGGLIRDGETVASALSVARANPGVRAPREHPVAVTGLRRVFRAGFEAPVTIEVAEGGGRAWLKGSDAYGYRWDDLDHTFEMVAAGSFGRLVTTEFSAQQFSAGQRSLFMRQNIEAGGSQNRLQFFSDDAAFKGEIYTRRHYFVPARNLLALKAEDDAVSIAGTREIRGGSAPPGAANADFSMPLYLVRRGDALIFSLAILDYSRGPYWSDWTKPPYGLLAHAEKTKAPLDRWFALDTYIKRDPVHGAIKVWLDGKPIFNLENVRTKNDTDRWFTKLADVDAEPAPFELYVDEVEIWTR
jgi:hypothetical protein